MSRLLASEPPVDTSIWANLLPRTIRRGHTAAISLLATLCLAVIGSSAFAQADAQKAFADAKKAFQAEKYVEARDLLKKAAETDLKNPEVFLLLGQAHYQLAELDEAIAAWRTTLELAPKHPYATRMIDALQGRAKDVATRFQLAEIMRDEGFLNAAGSECYNLLILKTLTDPERVRMMTLNAEISLAEKKYEAAEKIIQELLVRFPKLADPAKCMLILGQVKLHANDATAAEGLDLLKKVIAEHPNTAAATTASIEMALSEMRRNPSPNSVLAVIELEKQIAENPKHPLYREVRSAQLEALFFIANESAPLQSDAKPQPVDINFLALATTYYQRTSQPEEATKLSQRVLKHIEDRYAKQGAHVAGIEIVRHWLNAPLIRADRFETLETLARYQTAVAWEPLAKQGKAGSLPQADLLDSLPKPLSELLDTYQTIRKEFPTKPVWNSQVELAEKIRSLSAQVAWPSKVASLRGTDAWTIAILQPVIEADQDPKAVTKAVAVSLAIANEIPRSDIPSRALAVSILTKLQKQLGPSHAEWPKAIVAYYTLASEYATFVFQENIRTGNPEANAQMSEPQKALLTTLRDHIPHQAAQAPHALVQLAEHVKPWVAQSHWNVVEEAYAMVMPSLPKPQRIEAERYAIQLLLTQVARNHAERTALGLTVPNALDPIHEKALKRAYALQGEVTENESQLTQVRTSVDQVVDHYRLLDMYPIAEAALGVKADKPVDVADAYTQLRLAKLHDELARRDFTRSLKHYKSSDRIALSPAFAAVIEEYKKCITDRPQSRLVPQAVDGILGIARLYATHQAHAEIAGIYRELSEFASSVKVLNVSTSTSGEPSVAEQAAFDLAVALESEAKHELAKKLAEQAGKKKTPPTKLSPQFAAAIDAHRDFLKTRPKSRLAPESIGHTLRIAMHYVRLDAWDVAEGIYADLADSDLGIQRPERLDFCRAMCRLGHAIPDHAKTILAAFTQAGLIGSRPGSRDGGLLDSLVMTDPQAAGSTVSGGGMGGSGLGSVSGPLAANERRSRATATPSDAPTEEPAPDAAATTPSNQPPPGLPGRSATRAPGVDPDAQLLAMIRSQEANRANQAAMMNGTFAYQVNASNQEDTEQQVQQQGVQQGQARQQIVMPTLSEAELARQQKALTEAYTRFQAIRKDYPHSPTADQARAEIFVMISHWRSLAQWQRSAALAGTFLAANPTDHELPKIHLDIARDHLAWASKPVAKNVSRQKRLAEVASRFDAARKSLLGVVNDFADEKIYLQRAQWELAESYLKQARVVDAFSPTLARGQFVRAAEELRHVATKSPDHPRLAQIPQMLWTIAAEMEGRQYFDEAVLIWNDLAVYHPMESVAQQAAMKVAQTYHLKLGLPLRAAEAYQELNFARGGNDASLQNAIFQIGTELKNDRRWVEALHVLEVFVDTFPRHAQAGPALTTIGHIHQTNEAWEDAIDAYKRVIAEYQQGDWVLQAKWAIAECTINLSRWREASNAYQAFVTAYPKDPKLAEANRRIDVLKDLARYQALVDEPGQRKAFDAQFQIARIVQTQLANPVKAIIEYRKVVDKWSSSHLADDALFEIGKAHFGLGETHIQQARKALLAVAEKYPTSPLADDALLLVGQSYENEADRLASATREKTLLRNQDVAQRQAYESFQGNRRLNTAVRGKKVADLKKAGKGQLAEFEEASQAANFGQFNDANVKLFARQAEQQVATLTASQLADRQDKINAALRKAVEAFTAASQVAAADKADEALLQMATIYDQRLKDAQAAMKTWQEIVRQFSGTSVAEDASWRIAQFEERNGRFPQAIEAYKAFLRNYRRSPNAGKAQFAIAENYEHLGEWVNSMDSYTNYITNFPEGPLVAKAKEQINWIKTYRL